jgi:hypothetical protein
MTFPEYDKRLGGVIKDLQSGAHGIVMARMAINALTLIKQRVQEEGKTAKGSQFPPYSTKAMLIGCKSFIQKSACNTVFGSKDKRREFQWRTVQGHKLAILPGGYKQLREIQGRQTDHVDFMMTGRMWSDIAVISKGSDHEKGIAIIGAKTEDDKKKLAGNTKRKGDILDLSQEEIDRLKASYNLDVLQIFKNNGL